MAFYISISESIITGATEAGTIAEAKKVLSGDVVKITSKPIKIKLIDSEDRNYWNIGQVFFQLQDNGTKPDNQKCNISANLNRVYRQQNYIAFKSSSYSERGEYHLTRAGQRYWVDFIQPQRWMIIK